LEKYNLIFIWYHPNRENPFYDPPKIDMIDKGNYEFYKISSIKDIKMHIQEFAENSVDHQHFDCIHKYITIPWTKIEIPFLTINHRPDFKIDENEEHKYYFLNIVNSYAFGKDLHEPFNVKVTFYGCGAVTWFEFITPLGNIVWLHTNTPNTILNLDIQLTCFKEKKVPMIFAWFVMGMWYSNLLNDVDIWSTKVWRKNPVLIKIDGPIMKLRRLYEKFYVENDSEW